MTVNSKTEDPAKSDEDLHSTISDPLSIDECNEDNDDITVSILKKINYFFNENKNNKYEVNWDVMKLLGDFLDIHDYDTNLFSCWILKMLGYQALYVPSEADDNDYMMLVYWILDVMNIIKNDPDLTREEFFEIMSKISYEALSVILEDDEFLLPLQLMQRMTDANEFETFSNTTLSKSEKLLTVDEIFELKSMSEVSQLESKSRDYENLLHIVIEATYRIFGSEIDYFLIQSTIKNQESILYVIPYHFRKPKISKMPDEAPKLIAPASSKVEKSKKKTKSTQKNPTDAIVETVASTPNRFNFILPLAEAIETNEVLHQNKGNETSRNDIEPS